MAPANWTDREKITYLLCLMEHGGRASETPVPTGRTAVACKLMMQRLKAEYKPDIEALKAGATTPGDGGNTDGDDTPTATPKKATPKKATPKRKQAGGGEDSSPRKRGRPSKKTAEEVQKAAPFKDEEGIKGEADDDGAVDQVI